MRNIILAALFSFSVATVSRGEGVWVQDGWTCAAWAEARKGEQGYQLEQHLVGFFNGASLGSGRDFWHGGVDIDPQQVFFWMDQFCAANPLGYLVEGAANLATERLGEGWNLPPK